MTLAGKRNLEGYEKNYYPGEIISTMFKVPNNTLGHLFIKLMRTFLNRDTYRMRVRARGPRDGSTAQQAELPLSKAEWFAIYIDFTAKSNRYVGYNLDEKIKQDKERLGILDHTVIGSYNCNCKELEEPGCLECDHINDCGVTDDDIKAKKDCQYLRDNNLW